MNRIIVAIGGGENGRTKNDGIKLPYETKQIDQEIIRLTNKKNPNFLFLGHSQDNPVDEENYFSTMKSIYGDIFGCNCKLMKKSLLESDIQKVKELLSWADIIYEGGGNTKSMMEIWNKTGFDKLLREAWLNGKIMCGISAGANCWFNTCSSDSLKLQLKDNSAPFINVNCLNFINAFFTPHYNYIDKFDDRAEHMKSSLKATDLIGIGLSSCCAIEIINNKYRLITSDASNYGITAYGIKAYWNDNKYYTEYIDSSCKFKKLNNLLSKKS